ncbi:MAG: Ig-like domain-containing protein [Acidimicrobiales bacterium]
MREATAAPVAVGSRPPEVVATVTLSRRQVADKRGEPPAQSPEAPAVPGVSSRLRVVHPPRLCATSAPRSLGRSSLALRQQDQASSPVPPRAPDPTLGRVRDSTSIGDGALRVASLDTVHPSGVVKFGSAIQLRTHLYGGFGPVLGNITVTIDGETLCSTTLVHGIANCTLSSSKIGHGQHTLVVTYAGQGAYYSRNAAVVVTVT